LPETAKFCLNCGASVQEKRDTGVDRNAGIRVDQNVGTVEDATVTGAAVSGGAASGLNLDVGQKADTVKDGGAMVGAVIGDPGSTIHVGGQQQYGDTVHGDLVAGDKNVVDTQGGAYVGGGVNTGGGDFVSRDQIIHGDRVQGDKVGGDKVGGDKISIGDVSGNAAIAAGRSAQAGGTGDADADKEDPDDPAD
jgi:hypothetical protein